MNKKRSNTQYLLNLGWQRPELVCGVAILGHQTLTELHELICGAIDDSADTSFSFRFGNSEFGEGARLDELNLRVGQTFEYIVESVDENRRTLITVEFIDDE
jgi:hypothetical protein